MDLIRRLKILGSGLIAAAAVLAGLAIQHMQSLTADGYVCGGVAPHCPACPASLATLGLGAAVLAMAARIAPARNPGRRSSASILD